MSETQENTPAQAADAKAVYTPAHGEVTIFSTPWCGYCRNLKSQLQRSDVAYREVDIEQHPDAAGLVEQINNGDQVVPTVIFPDGSSATNPSAKDVLAKLAA